jgi:hypothetical protein
MRVQGHTIRAICYVPVHDNYLYNKVAVKQNEGTTVSVSDMIAFPMSERCKLLNQLLQRERTSGRCDAETAKLLEMYLVVQQAERIYTQLIIE